MTNYEVMLLGWGNGGASLVQLLLYYFVRQRNSRFDFFRAGVITFVSGLGCLAYFTYVDSKPATFLLALHYGVFLALVINEVCGLFDWHIEHAEENGYVTQKRTEQETVSYSIASMLLLLVGCSKTSSGSIVNFLGYLKVFGTASVGATLIEIRRLMRMRSKGVKLEFIDYLLSFSLILTSSIVACIHGDISVYTAMQLGTTIPLIVGAKDPK